MFLEKKKNHPKIPKKSQNNNVFWKILYLSYAYLIPAVTGLEKQFLCPAYRMLSVTIILIQFLMFLFSEQRLY